MRSAILVAIGCLAVVAMVGPAQAAVVNGGFEAVPDHLVGWTTTPALGGGAVSVVTSFTGYDGPNSTAPKWNPVEGNYFAVLTPGVMGTYTTLSQLFSATASQKLSFSVFWDGGDYLTSPGSQAFNDDGYVKLIPANTTPLYAASIQLFGDYGNNGWTQVEYTIGTAGDYTIEAGVRNVGDGSNPSYIGLDNVVLASPTPPDGQVPEPASLAIWGALSGLGLISARKARKQAV